MMIRNVDAVKQIGVKDFDHFSDHTPIFTSPDVEDVGGESLFGNSLFALRGQKWRDMRATLSPAFTGMKMRHMFELVSKCAESTSEFFLSEAKTGKKLEYEMKEIFSRFCNDVIASVAFGIQVDSFRDRENNFYVNGKELLNFRSIKTVLRILLFRVVPAIPKMFKMDIASSKLTAYFRDMIIENIKHRDDHGIVRNDMIQMLMQVRKGTLKHQVLEEKDTKDAGFATVEESSIGRSLHNRKWTDNELVSQCFLFFLAGFDSISTVLTFACYELLVNSDVQQKLYEEIVATDESLGGKDLTYDVLQKMQYMDMVVSETLRMWPPAPFTDRFCVKNYVYDDGTGTRIKMDKGQTLWFPITAFHHDSKYFPNPYKFDPDRFSEENRDQIIPNTYLPFGIGPRNCIGSRFALMEVKAVLYSLLRKFTFERTEKSKIPVRLSESIIVMQTKDGVWLELKPRG
ncbi:probable cytochrome P450 9f2 isoform X2 [Malaya genurostris]|nr:probable cytochrome P450 9f2 isoform X2 [Malaya genurostris]